MARRTTGSVMTEETRILYARTLREARTAARLNHPAVVTIFDVVEADGSPWIVMELVEARSLDQVLTEDGPLAPHRVADLGARVLGALACAHAAGILHRDVKPSNVLLGPDGRVVLTDFGIATLEGDSGLTQAGMVMGTPGFTAPERIRGDPASPASDLWSLGATLYAAVEGRGPFDDRGTSIAILAAIANGEAPRPRQAGPLRPVIEALLHRNPQARPDAAAVGRLLAAAREQRRDRRRRRLVPGRLVGERLRGRRRQAVRRGRRPAADRTDGPGPGLAPDPGPGRGSGPTPGPAAWGRGDARGPTRSRRPGQAWSDRPGQRPWPEPDQPGLPTASKDSLPGSRPGVTRTPSHHTLPAGTATAARRQRTGIWAWPGGRVGGDAAAWAPGAGGPRRRPGHRGRRRPGGNGAGPREQRHRRPVSGGGLAGRDREPGRIPGWFQHDCSGRVADGATRCGHRPHQPGG